MAGRGSLAGLMAYGNANEIVKDMAREVLTIVEHTPVLAGVNGTDPFLLRDSFLRELKGMGFAGIQNFPTVGLIDGTFRANLEETGMSYQLEVETIAAARELDLLTTPYVFNIDEARRMTTAGADLIVAHMGLTTGGSIGAESAKTLDGCVREVQGIVDAAKALRPEVFVLCHGGPIATPMDAQFMLERCTGLDGFYGASSMERLPTEKATRPAEVKNFSALRLWPSLELQNHETVPSPPSLPLWWLQARPPEDYHARAALKSELIVPACNDPMQLEVTRRTVASTSSNCNGALMLYEP